MEFYHGTVMESLRQRMGAINSKEKQKEVTLSISFEAKNKSYDLNHPIIGLVEIQSN